MNNLTRIAKSTTAAIDLATIIVGILVLSILTGLVGATVYAVIPWTHDRASKADLTALAAAEQAYSNNHTDNVDTSVDHFASYDSLLSSKLVQKDSDIKLLTNAANTCYVATSTSESGAIYWVDSDNPNPVAYSSNPVSNCGDLNSLIPAAQRVGVMKVTWDSTASACLNAMLPINSDGGTTTPVNVNINWGDGSSTNNAGENPTHTYSTSGVKTITIVGSFGTWGGAQYATTQATKAPGNAYRTCLTSITQWKDTQTTNAYKGFYLARNLTSVAQIPSTLTNATYMFAYLYSGGPALDVSSLNTSNITNMSYMFYASTAFNGDITNWNVSQVQDMSYMFMNAYAFNQPVGSWNVGNVTNMDHIFTQAKVFNQPLNTWNTGNVTNLASAFYGASVFNQPLNNWNTAKVKSLNQTFGMTPVFNQNISGWNTTNVTDMYGTFMNTTVFNQPLNTWDVSNVQDMSFMFGQAKAFNQPLNNWKTNSLQLLNQTFVSTGAFNQDISTWNTSNVTSMLATFSNTTFNMPLSTANGTWDTGKVTNFGSMFASNTVFNQNLSFFKLTGATPANGGVDINNMFSGTKVFVGTGLNSWSTTNVVSIANTFSYTSAFNTNISSWNVGNVTNMSGAFASATAFNQNISSWNTANVTNMSYTFSGASIFNQAIGSWNVGNVTTMANMFAAANTFNQSLTNWSVSNVTDMSYMFSNNSIFNQPLSGWNTKTGKVAKMDYMFQGTGAFNQNLTGWTVSQAPTHFSFGTGSATLQLTNYPKFPS